MDASGSAPIYYAFDPSTPNTFTPSLENSSAGEIKKCSIRGCTQTITDESNNKMCDACRGRHRIYATTKRARRKLEKAASSNSQQSTWVLTTGDTYPQETLSGSHQPQSSISPLPTTIIWDTSVDQNMFVGDSEASGSMVHHPLRPAPPTSTSSELANALTFPPPRIPVIATPTVLKDQLPLQEEIEAAQQDNPPLSSEGQGSDDKDDVEIELQYPPMPERFCSVKGCKAVIPGSYDFKMCPPCRERYRIYGNTKRAKWKHERETFERDMSVLRAAEDQRRKVNGLGPLADNIEELRAWEFSIIDEEVPISPSEAVMNEGSGSVPSTSGSTSETGGRPPALAHSIVLAGVYPSSIDSPHAISPYPHRTEPLPARMCTVSHCHKILPGYYRYKRCEYHRRQNRLHSKLKREKEKEEKSMGPGENMGVPDEDGSAIPRQRKPKGEYKETKAASEAKDGITQNRDALAEGTLFVSEYDPIVSKAEAEKKNSKGICATLDCHNLLVPGARWRTCEDCRTMARRRKFQARAEQKATENQYWRGVAEKMSTARKQEESNMPIASGSGSGGSPTVDSTSGLAEGIPADVNEDSKEDDTDADADGDAETDPDAADEAQVLALVDEETRAVIDTDIPQGRQLIWKTTETGRPEPPPVWTKGYTKFRVSLPPTPPSPPPLRTAEELMKLEDPLAFRGFKPTTTPSAIGRILARNPSISVDAFSEILEADGTKSMEASAVSQVQTEAPVLKPVPTPTIPTSEPFIYKAPEKKPAPGTSSTSASTSSKGKRKANSEERHSVSSSGSISTLSAPHNQMLAPPPSPFIPPYGYQPSYPYYPYYHLPPYQMPPYPYVGTDGPPTLPNQHPHTSGPPSTSPPNFYPYSYPPQAYGYPPAMSYMPPRYPSGVPSQQPYSPYSGFSPSAAPIPYPYYPQPSTAPIPMPVSVPASITPPSTIKPKAVSKITAPNWPPVRVDIKKDGNFNHYHYGVETPPQPTTTPEVNFSEKPKQRPKRRKMDPDYLAKYQSLVSARTLATSETNQAFAQSALLSESGDVNLDAVIQPEAMEGTPSEPRSFQSVTRTCATKTCQRNIESDIIGNICEKCKLKLKKHQIKTKKKFNLEPRKFLLDKDSIKKAD